MEELLTPDRSWETTRWRFLAGSGLTLSTAGGGYMVQLVRGGEPPKFLPVSKGETAELAVDAAIARYELALDQRIHPRRY